MVTRASAALVQVNTHIKWNPLKDARVVGLLSVIVVLIIWQIVGSRISYATSYPSAIFRAAIHTTIPDVLPAFGATMEAFWTGLGISVVVGVPVGLLMGRSSLVRLILAPYVTLMNSTPFVAFFPLFILLFGLGFELRVCAVVVTSIWAIIINTYLGVREVESSLLDVGTAFAARRPLVLRSIVLPATMRYIFAGIRVGFGHGLIGMVVIEIEASVVGVGSLLSQDANLLRLDLYFVPLAYLGFFSILCTYLINLANRWVTMPWTRPSTALLMMLGMQDRAKLTDAKTTGRKAISSGKRRPVSAAASRDSAAPLRHRRAALQGAVMREPGVLSRALRSSVSSAAGAWGIRLIALAAILVVWQVYAAGQSNAVIPEPTKVAGAVWTEFFVTGSIYGPLASSCLVLLMAFAAALAIGIPIGIVMGRSRLVERVLEPYIAWLYGLPHVAFIPLMVVWIGFGLELRFFYAVFSAVFIIIINTIAGVKSISPELLACGRSFCASERQIVRTIVLPGATPFIVAGAKLGFSATWIGVVVAEIIATQSGLGGLITSYSNNFYMPQMAVPILVIMAISVGIFGLTNWLQPKLTPWAPSSSTTSR